MVIEPAFGQVYDTNKVVLTTRGKTGELNGVGPPILLTSHFYAHFLPLSQSPALALLGRNSVPGKETVPDYTPENRPYLRLCDLPAEERPRERLYHVGERALSTTELLAIVIGSGHGNDNVLQLAQLLLSDLDGLSGLARASTNELRQVKGIGEVKAAQIKAALELGRRATKAPRSERPIVRSPAEAAHLLMPEMSNLEQEHTRVILLDTRNYALSMPTIYIGNLNSTVIRVAELFRIGIRENAASLIVAHNHPSGDPAPHRRCDDNQEDG